MSCPKCGNRPVPFARWMRTRDPFHLTCVHCHSELTVGAAGWIWTLLHVPLAAGLVSLHNTLRTNGLLEGWWAFTGYSTLALALVFVTAWVVPWFGFRSAYKLRD